MRWPLGPVLTHRPGGYAREGSTMSTTTPAKVSAAEAKLAAAEIEGKFGEALAALQELGSEVDIPRDRGVAIGPVHNPTVRDPEAAMRLLVLVANIRTDLSAIAPEVDCIEESVLNSYGDVVSGEAS
jgi:hypothetical protein